MVAQCCSSAALSFTDSLHISVMVLLIVQIPQSVSFHHSLRDFPLAGLKLFPTAMYSYFVNVALDSLKEQMETIIRIYIL